MKIKLKVKTIIAIIISLIFIFLIAAPIITYEIAYVLNSRGSDKAEVFYDAYFSYPIKFNEDRSLYEMVNHISGGFARYSLFANKQWSSNVNLNPNDLIKSKKALERILYEFEDSKYYPLAYSKIMDLAIANQDTKGLLDWIEWGKFQDNEELIYSSDIYRAYYLFANRDYKGASLILDKYSQEQVDFRHDFLKGNLLAFGPNEELALKYFDQAVDNIDYDYSLFGSSLPDRRDEWYNEYIGELKGDYKIKGKVTYDGEPMPFVEIYVQKEDSGYNVGYNDLIGITDINGEFETLGLRSGIYDIGVGINPSIVYDKVYLRPNSTVLELYSDIEFDFQFTSAMEILSPGTGTLVEDDKFTVSWEPVTGAEYYQIQTINFFSQTNKTGAYRFTIVDNKGNSNIRDTSVELDIQKLKKFVNVMGYDGDDLRVGPSAILGTFFPGNEYSIMVKAFDNKGNLLGSSIPLIKFYDELTTVKIEGQISEGEDYILESNYEAAIEHYEEILQVDPSNEEALIYLSKIYGFGWMEKPDYIARAIEYAKEYMDIYDDGSLLLVVIGSMNRDYMSEYSDLIQKAFDTISIDDRGSMYYSELGRFKSNLGEYEAAREAYEHTENYIPIDLLYMDLYLEDMEKALDRLEDSRLGIHRMSIEILRNNIKEFNEDVLQSDDYTMFKGLLEEYISGNLKRDERRDLLLKTIQSINNKNIKEVLHQIKLEDYFDREY